MKKQKVRFTSVLLMVILILGLVSMASGQKRNYLEYPRALDKTVVVVDGRELTLQDIAFYIAYEENLVEQDALLYSPQNTAKYWNLRSKGTFARVKAKEAVLQMAVHDEIFYRMAEMQGVVLNEQDEAYLLNTQMDFWSDMDEALTGQLGVTEEILNESMRKIALAEKYQYLLAEMEGKAFEEYSLSGEAYQKLLEEHPYEIKEKVWERVHFGTVTVEH